MIKCNVCGHEFTKGEKCPHCDSTDLRVPVTEEVLEKKIEAVSSPDSSEENEPDPETPIPESDPESNNDEEE